MLKRTLSRSANAEPDDVLKTKRALIKAGLYEIPDWGLTPFPDEAMFRGIEALQRRLGHSRPDGVARPDGETAQALARLNGGAGGMVRVNAYEQTRGGHATPVSEHFRQPPGQGGGQGAQPKGSPVGRMPEIRGCDGSPYGCGHYGANRKKSDGTLSKHKGVDVKTTPGETIYSPVSGVVTDTSFDPYHRDPDVNKRDKLSAIQIRTNDGHIVEVLYVNTETANLKRNQRIEAGKPIGTAQDLSKVYPSLGDTRMTNHVDIRIKDKNGIYKDPTPLVRGQWPRH